MGKVRAFDVAFLDYSYKLSMQLLWRVVYFIGRPYCSWTLEKKKKRKIHESIFKIYTWKLRP